MSSTLRPRLSRAHAGARRVPPATIADGIGDSATDPPVPHRLLRLPDDTFAPVIEELPSSRRETWSTRAALEQLQHAVAPVGEIRRALLGGDGRSVRG